MYVHGGVTSFRKLHLEGAIYRFPFKYNHLAGSLTTAVYLRQRFTLYLSRAVELFLLCYIFRL